ncbi:MAG: response regulator [Tenericutes bacterium]|jgi:two-component system cell cycle response regulator|nr:response regulator [Mycoplasmatota bacterium]
MYRKISDNIYLISKENNNIIHCNTYLIVDKEEAILIEPGNIADFEAVFSDIKSIINLCLIKYIIISHPDPDLTASLPLFEEALNDVQIITEWRTAEIITFYNLKSKYYLIKENNHELRLKSGRVLRFIPTPFAHYSGSFITYDMTTEMLFSGDLFGAISKKWTLYADESYVESMAIFHENYMPSSDFIRPIMKDLLDYNIKYILPQHGSVIKSNLVSKSILFLYHLDFYNTPRRIVNKNNTSTEIDFLSRLVQIVIRLNQVFSSDDIKETFIGSPITMNFEPVNITSAINGYKLWHMFFDIVYAKRGDYWLNAVETLVNRISETYNIDKPNIYDLRLRKLKEQNIEITTKYSNLEESLKQTAEAFSKTKDLLTRCPITGLYNKDMAIRYLEDHYDDLTNHGYLINIDIDQIVLINHEYSNKVGDDMINVLKYVINNNLEDDELLFKGKGSSLILLKQKSSNPQIKKRAEDIRNIISKSDQFIEKVSVSMGIVRLKPEEMVAPTQQINEWMHLLESRLEYAKSQGDGQIIFEGQKELIYYRNTILLVDEEQININLITKYFQEQSFKVIHAINPMTALEVLEKQKVDLIISEINLSKLDGFSLKKSLNEKPYFAKLPFIFLSHIKNETLIDRANRLNVNYFLKKPFYMNELIGLVKRAIK